MFLLIIAGCGIMLFIQVPFFSVVMFLCCLTKMQAVLAVLVQTMPVHAFVFCCYFTKLQVFIFIANSNC